MRFQTAVDRLQSSSNITMSTFRKEMEAELEVKMEKKQTILGNKLEGEMEQLKSEVKTATEKVAVTSCAPSTITYGSGEIIKFSEVKLSNGIGNVDNFKSSGTFTCEKPGLYLVGVYIMSYSNYAQFQIRKNGRLLSYVHVNPVLQSTGDNNKYHTGTGIMAVQLNTNDKLNIKAGTSKMPVYGGYSCLTIIKVK
ncbi:uncharacterized protein LOC127716199 [Mytilus californianus]|uniref:uncharacterized protein LOC127716199 n=1 Tax=Mytilus californianus TaxID=6549 RepID=UPI00224833D0|nr:uncharacterized protein LOC127716199 [Mytilus californianus]